MAPQLRIERRFSVIHAANVIIPGIDDRKTTFKTDMYILGKLKRENSFKSNNILENKYIYLVGVSCIA